MSAFDKDRLFEYAASFSSDELPILAELDRETHLKVLNPRMLSGHLQGTVLQFLSKLIQPKYVLEIGTYTGYSAICMAQGMQQDGILYTIDINEELLSMVQRYIDKAGLTNCIKPLTGDAKEIIPTLDCSFDLVFIDADKENYAQYYHLVFDKLNKGGFIIADNVLWDGKVLHPERYTDAETAGIVAFNELVKNDHRTEKLLLPIRDGLYLIRKL